MQKHFKLIVDSLCEVYDLLVPYLDGEFYDINSETIVPNAVYLIGRKQFHDNITLIKQLVDTHSILPVLANPAEGSDTIRWQVYKLDIVDLVQQGKIVILTGGDLPNELTNFHYENFMPKLLDYQENINAAAQYQQSWTVSRPYKFLFLNGRARPHRRYLIKRLEHLLPDTLWTNLDSTVCGSRELEYLINGQDQLLIPGKIKLLDQQYEFDFYQSNMDLPLSGFVKYQLFDHQWGEIYIKANTYIDTYFSLVTETVFEYSYSFRTEKIWKPICIGHPFIAVGNRGYYRDLQQLGYRTFGNLIDESFDQIDNSQDRIDRIAAVVEDLCNQNLSSFVMAADETCKYNQQLLAELGPQVRQEFPQRLIKYFNERFRI